MELLYARYKVVLLLVGAALAAAPAIAAQPRAGAAAPPSVLDDPFVQRQAQRGLDHLYNMEFAEAARFFERVDRRYPDHPIGPFLKALNTWWKVLLDLSDTSHDDAFFAEMDEVIRRSDRLLKRDKENFDAFFFKGAALGFRGRLRSNRGDWFKAAMDGKRAMDYVLAVAEKAPENHDYIFGKGIYDYYAAVIPDRYPFTKPVMVFFPQGDRERGIRELQRTAQHGRYIQTEAVYFLLQIYYLFEHDYANSVASVSWLRDRHPNNSFFHTFEGRVYARWGQWAQVERIYEEVLERYREGMTGYNQAAAEQAYYFLARAQMASGGYEQAVEHLRHLQRLTARRPDDTYFHVWGRFRQGMAYDALGKRDQAVRRYREVLAMEDHAGVHERAKQYLQSPYGPPGRQ